MGAPRASVRGLFRAGPDGPPLAEPRSDGRSAPAGHQGLDGDEAQGGHISAEPRINDRIRVPEVRLVGPNGEQVGIVALNDALRLAQEADLDLVEVAPTARPPVCKLMDYGKFKYESALKARESRKNQAQTVIKEIKLRPKIDPHDYGTKKGHVERFLKQGDKVKVTIMFRGREQSRPELGFRLLQRLAGDVEELGFVEAQPKQDGRNMIMVIGPHRKKSESRAERTSREAPDEAPRPVPRPRRPPAAGGSTCRPAQCRPAQCRPAQCRGRRRGSGRRLSPGRTARSLGAGGLPHDACRRRAVHPCRRHAEGIGAEHAEEHTCRRHAEHVRARAPVRGRTTNPRAAGT